jgi:hypothetical protein
VLALVLGVLAGAGSLPAQPVEAQPFGTVVVQKQLVLPSGAAAMVQDLSGFVFVLRSGGQDQPMPPTNAAGQTSVGVAPGNYTITEEPRAGATFLGTFIGNQRVDSFAVAAGQTVTLNAVNQVSGSAGIQIVKQILDANNNVIQTQGTMVTGVTYTVTGPNNFSTTVQTNAMGQALLTNLAAGAYTVTEQVPPGYVLVNATVDGALAPSTPQFQVNAGQTRVVLFNNRQVTSGTVTITKQIVDANNNVVAGASRSGFSFTLTCPTAASQSAVTDANGVATFTNVPAGVCQLTETLPAGFTFVSGQVGTTTPVMTNPGNYTVTAGQPLTINVINRQAPTQPQTEAIGLIAGCNNVALTWAMGTPVSTVAAAVTPANAVEAIWRQTVVGDRLVFQAWSPAPGAPSDYTVTGVRPEAAWICVRFPATLNRPVLN